MNAQHLSLMEHAIYADVDLHVLDPSPTADYIDKMRHARRTYLRQIQTCTDSAKRTQLRESMLEYMLEIEATYNIDICSITSEELLELLEQELGDS